MAWRMTIMQPIQMARSVARALILAGWLLGGWGAMAQSPASAPVTEDYDTLARRLYEHHDKGEYREGLACAEKMLALKPKDPQTIYNMACMHCLCGNRDDAYRWLEKSIEAGLADPALPENDEDLRALRADDRFKELLNRMRKPPAPPKAPIAPKEKPVVRPRETPKPKDDPSPRTQAASPQPSRAASATSISMEGLTGLMIPAGSASAIRGPAALAVLLHGADEDPQRMVDRWKEAGEKAGLLLAAPAGPRHEGAAMYRWSDLAASTERVESFIDLAKKRHAVDEKRIALAGFCQGGRVAMRMLLEHPDRYAGAILTATDFDRLLEGSMAAGALKGKRIYIMVGDHDSARLVDSSDRAGEALKAAGANVIIKHFPDTGHAYPEPRSQEISAALAYVLGL